MPLKIPSLDDRAYQQLLDEALARVPIHNPEWTNFNQSDPGVTLIELFAFLTETLLYRANQIPERNHRKFLSLLGLPLLPASSARGLVTFTNERGPMETVTLPKDFEVRAGQVPFRTVLGLDVLPVEGRVYFKRPRAADATLLSYYKDLYAALQQDGPSTPVLYETVQLDTAGSPGVNLNSGLANDMTVDGALWVALLVRGDLKVSPELGRQMAREALANKTLNLGFVPRIDADDPRVVLPPGGKSETRSELVFELPRVPASGRLGPQEAPSFRLIHHEPVPTAPVVIQIPLPPEQDPDNSNQPSLDTWRNLDPLEAGAGGMPPALPDPTLEERVITWLRIKAPAGAALRVLWAGINSAEVVQRAYVVNEALPDGNGEPDQSCTLSKRPVLPESVRLTVSGVPGDWKEIEDLMTAGPEVPAPDPRDPYGRQRAPNPRVNVFTLDPEAGVLRFGDGTRGRRPPPGALMRASYAYGLGSRGNVGKDAITSGPALGPGFKVTNPSPTWGGADAESVTNGERQITRHLQHRDRLVTARDFEVITRRTPGIEVGRVDVIPVWNPALGPNQPGDAPGAVTLMLIPRHSATQPDAPMPDEAFLGAVCRHLETRRLVTTEVILSGPKYKPIWVSVGINVAANHSFAEVRVAVEAALRRALSPLPADPAAALAEPDPLLSGTASESSGETSRGWPRHKPVDALELFAVVARVPGVFSVNKVLIADGNNPAATSPIEMTGLQLPRLAGLSVTSGDPVDLATLRGLLPAAAPAVIPLPVPFIPKEC